MPASAADDRGGHGRAQAARSRGVVRQDPPGMLALQLWAMSCEPTRDALRLDADETGGSREVVPVGLHEPARDRDLLGRGFEQAASKNYVGVDGWAPYRCFKKRRLLQPLCTVATSFAPTLGQGHWHALALSDRRDAGEISPHACALPRDSSRPPAAVHQSCGFASYIGTTSLLRTWATNYPAELREPQDLRRRQPYRERGTGPVDPHERAAVTKGSA